MVTGGSAYTSAENSKAVDTIAYGTYWKDRILSVGGFDEGIDRGQDWDINLRLTQQGQKLMLLSGSQFITSSEAHCRKFTNGSGWLGYGSQNPAQE